ncbi:MAG: LysM peptidoglycan-binding domain-containing protein [Lautropia sp.]|nr:LysM peptidoglycan-binding domain-containing protein [Lautropia sp.]
MSLKKFSIRRLSALAIGAGLAAGGAIPVVPALAQQATPPIALAPGAPDKHVVVKGDTLWDISATFLKSPWRWPEVWQLNREQIANPHLIYPGDIVYLDTSGVSPRLRLGKRVDGMAANGQGSGDGIRRLEPVVRAEQLDKEAISTISSASIAAFVNRPLIVDIKGLAESPRIVATQEGRVYLGRGDRAYVRGIKEDGITDWHVYRPAKPLLDPDTRQPLAYEALYLGTAQVVRKGDPTTIRIVDNAEEIGEGDRLVPAEAARAINFAPRPPEKDVAGKIVSVYRGITQVGRNSVVALNRGKNHGLDVGHVLTVQLTGRLAKDREANELVKLPNEPIGQLLVFRTFDNIAYGLIVDASQSISVGDSVANP